MPSGLRKRRVASKVVPVDPKSVGMENVNSNHSTKRECRSKTVKEDSLKNYDNSKAKGARKSHANN